MGKKLVNNLIYLGAIAYLSLTKLFNIHTLKTTYGGPLEIYSASQKL